MRCCLVCAHDHAPTHNAACMIMPHHDRAMSHTGCRQARCGLIDGETSEMPSMYAQTQLPSEYDIAGLAVGAAVKHALLLPRAVCAGDVLLGLPSSGLHCNGFSLVRKTLQERQISYSERAPWGPPTAPAVTVGA